MQASKALASHAPLNYPGHFWRDSKTEPLQPGQCRSRSGADADGCPRGNRAASAGSLLQRPEAGAGQSRDGDPSGLSSFLEFCPCCHSDSGLRPAPLQIRFPLLFSVEAGTLGA